MADAYDISDLATPVANVPASPDAYDVSGLATPTGQYIATPTAPRQTGDGSVLTAARDPSGKVWDNPEGWKKTAMTGLQAANEGAIGALDLIGWPVRSAMNGAIGLWNNATDSSVEPIPTIAERQNYIGNTNNPNLTPDSTWSLPERRAYSTVKGATNGATAGIPFGPAGVLGGAVGGAVAENSGDAARESGMGTAGQVAASILGGVGGGKLAELGARGLTAGGRLLTGGDFRSGLTAPSDAYAIAKEVGVTPRLAGDFSQSAEPRILQSALAGVPGSSTYIQRAMGQQTDDFARAVGSAATMRGQNATTPAEAGQAIKSMGEDWLQRFRNTNETNLNALNGEMGSAQVPLTATKALLNQFNAKYAGDPALASKLTPTEYKQWSKIINDPRYANGMDWQTVRDIKSDIGSKLADPAIFSSTSKGQYEQLYKALSNDIGTTAEATSPSAKTAFDKFNGEAKSGYDFMNNHLGQIMKPSTTPESAYNYAMSQPSRLQTLRDNLLDQSNPEKWNTVGSSIINRMGSANAGAQNAAGDAFSVNNYLTNWNKITPEAKAALFGHDPEVMDRLTKLAQTADTLKSSQKYNNHSNTAYTSAALGGAGFVGKGAWDGYEKDGLTGAATGALLNGAMVYGGASALGKGYSTPGVAAFMAKQKTPALQAMQNGGLLGVAATSTSPLYRNDQNK